MVEIRAIKEEKPGFKNLQGFDNSKNFGIKSSRKGGMMIPSWTNNFASIIYDNSTTCTILVNPKGFIAVICDWGLKSSQTVSEEE